MELRDSLGHMLSTELRHLVFEKFNVIVSIMFRIIFFLIFGDRLVYSLLENLRGQGLMAVK